ncbi:MAG TPA: rRNA pseudouridine synthase [Bacteroidetes bacterium]|nr:rRNA pseudouridine synthase [Bacteroidota bacterium]
MKKRPSKHSNSPFGKPAPRIARRTEDKPKSPPPSGGPMRLNKYIAHCGICARRQAAEHVKNGQVAVNGKVETNPGYVVQESDEVTFKGKPVKLETKKVYILLNKPKNVITTSKDDKGRKTVLDIVGKDIPERIFPVGRLDRNTTGLLLLTNDGDLAKKLSHPSYGVTKFYHVKLDKKLSPKHLEEIRKGLKLEDGLVEVDGADYVQGKKDEIGVEIHLGRNRIVRRIFEHLGYHVERLDRTYYAGLTKKDIGRGYFRHLSEREVIMLKHFK